MSKKPIIHLIIKTLIKLEKRLEIIEKMLEPSKNKIFIKKGE